MPRPTTRSKAKPANASPASPATPTKYGRRRSSLSPNISRRLSFPRTFNEDLIDGMSPIKPQPIQEEDLTLEPLESPEDINKNTSSDSEEIFDIDSLVRKPLKQKRSIVENCIVGELPKRQRTLNNKVKKPARKKAAAKKKPLLTRAKKLKVDKKTAREFDDIDGFKLTEEVV